MKRQLVFLFCATALLFACSEQDHPLADIVPEPVAEETAAVTEKGTFVSEEEATAVAEAFFRNQADEGIATKSETSLFQSPTSIETIKAEAGDPLMYVMNYSEGGFALVSATRDYYPVLAYSDEGSFELAPDMGPVEVWIEETKAAFRTKETLDAETKATIRRMWTTLETDGFRMPQTPTLRSYDPQMYAAYQARSNQLYIQYGPQGWDNVMSLDQAESYFTPNGYSSLCDAADSYGSPPEYTIVVLKTNYVTNQVGPLLTTEWDQGYPFNYNCNGYPAGCAAISIAQIMKFFGKPIAYNWSNMPNTGSATSPTIHSTPTMIRLVGDRLGLNYTNGSVGARDNDIKDALQSFYYSYTLANHNPTTVKNWLFNEMKPISMGGYTNNTLGIPSGSGHQWVCDGVRGSEGTTTFFVEFINPGSYDYYNSSGWTPSYPGEAISSTTLLFHMNWGWGGDYDGWFVSNSANSGNGNYQYGRTNFYINP